MEETEETTIAGTTEEEVVKMTDMREEGKALVMRRLPVRRKVVERDGRKEEDSSRRKWMMGVKTQGERVLRGTRRTSIGRRIRRSPRRRAEDIDPLVILAIPQGAETERRIRREIGLDLETEEKIDQGLRIGRESIPLTVRSLKIPRRTNLTLDV